MLALDPNETVEITLDADKGKEGAAKFICRYLTCRQWLTYAKLLEKAMKETTDVESYKTLSQAFEMVITGWTLDKPFSIDAILDVLAPSEAWELAHNIPSAIRLSEIDKKKSYSPQP
jgi:hypothetical protein